MSRILVVDDEPEVRDVMYDLLSSRGFDVVLAESGEEALAVLGPERTDRPDLVLLDVFMPGMDGAETLRRIAVIEPPVPVIMITANTDPDVTSKLLRLGAVDYLPKPFDLEYLVQAVNIQLAAVQDR
jgi:CheY-like chemotaxis protein